MYEHDFCEYAVRRKYKGAYLAAVAAVSVLFALFVVCFFLLILPLVGLLWGLVILTLAGTLAWYLSRFTYIEYEYSQTGAVFDGAAVYNKQYRREKVSVDLKKSARLIAPYKDGHIEGGFNPKKIMDLRSESDIPNAYILVYEAEGGCEAVLFDATARMIDNLRAHVPSVTVLSDGLPEE